MSKEKNQIKSCETCGNYKFQVAGAVSTCNAFHKSPWIARSIYCLGFKHWRPIPKKKK